MDRSLGALFPSACTPVVGSLAKAATWVNASIMSFIRACIFSSILSRLAEFLFLRAQTCESCASCKVKSLNQSYNTQQ